jgi:hypothetical protein
MKALHKMDNLDKGELLCKLFPEEMENIQNAKKAVRILSEKEITIREGWYQKGFLPLNFGTGLCRMHKG